MLSMLLTVLMFTTQPTTPECAEGLIHYPPLCLTQAEYDAIIAPIPQTPPPVAYTEGVEQWRPLVAFYWGKHGQYHVDRMLRIMWCESRGLPWAWNKSTDVRGLFQIRWPIWHKKWAGDYFDPWINVATAYQIWLEAGTYGSPYQPWACKGYA